MFLNFRSTIFLGTPSEYVNLCLNITPKKTQVISRQNLSVYKMVK